MWAFAERPALDKDIKPNWKTNAQPLFVSLHDAKPMLANVEGVDEFFFMIFKERNQRIKVV